MAALAATCSPARTASPPRFPQPLGADLHHEDGQARQRREPVRSAGISYQGGSFACLLPGLGRCAPRLATAGARHRHTATQPGQPPITTWPALVQIFIVLELITGGELFDKIVSEGRCVVPSQAHPGLVGGAAAASTCRFRPCPGSMRRWPGTTSASSSREYHTAIPRVFATVT